MNQHNKGTQRYVYVYVYLHICHLSQDPESINLINESPSQRHMNQTFPFNTITVALMERLELLLCPAQ